MKAQTLCEPAPIERTSRASVWSELFKARLTGMVLVTAAVGFYLGSAGRPDLWLFAHALLGTAMVASGAAALNQYLERNWDAIMERTAHRPLPSGNLQPETALVAGGALAGAGMIYLAVATNLLTSVLGAASLLSYLFIYTPLKRRTTLNTVIGAVPGAIPPLMGWTAARGDISIEGWALFAIQFFWQLPHFMAIGWLYREDYRRAGFVMLPAVDPDGARTGCRAVSHTLGLIVISLFPVALGMAGAIYAAGALILGLSFLAFAVQFSRGLDRVTARRLFLASIVYLPLLFGILISDQR